MEDVSLVIRLGSDRSINGEIPLEYFSPLETMSISSRRSIHLSAYPPHGVGMDSYVTKDSGMSRKNNPYCTCSSG